MPQEDHLAADPDAKWPLLTLARLKEAQVGWWSGSALLVRTSSSPLLAKTTFAINDT